MLFTQKFLLTPKKTRAGTRTSDSEVRSGGCSENRRVVRRKLGAKSGLVFGFKNHFGMRHSLGCDILNLVFKIGLEMMKKVKLLKGCKCWYRIIKRPVPLPWSSKIPSLLLYVINQLVKFTVAAVIDKHKTRNFSKRLR